jgi:hypothetical protein
MELGSVTLKRIGFFCFPIKHSTHTRRHGGAGGCHGEGSIDVNCRLRDRMIEDLGLIVLGA